MNNKDRQEFGALCRQMGALLSRQTEPWKLIYAMMDDIYDGYWREERTNAGTAADVDGWRPTHSKQEMLIAWRMYCNTQLHIWVSTSRRVGTSWAVIGDTLGITKQAAQQKYGKK